MEGWISLYRKLLDNELWQEKRKFSRAEAWIDLLLLANHKDHEIIVMGINVPLKAGDLFWSQAEMAKKWGWSKTKVKNFLNLLQSKQQITYKVVHRIGITSIANWDKYQKSDTIDQYIEKPKKSHRPVPNNNDNNDNNENNNSKGKLQSNYAKYVDFFNELTGRKFRATDTKAERQFNYLRKAGYQREDFAKVIINAYADKHHKESNFKYLTPEFLTRPDKFDRYFAMEDPIKKSSKQSEEENLKEYQKMIEMLKS